MTPLFFHFTAIAAAAAAATPLRGSRKAWPPIAFERATAAVANLSLLEKVSLVSGQNLNYHSKNCSIADPTCNYVGYIYGVPRLSVPDITLEDGPQGVADGMLSVTQFPSMMAVAQTWEPALFAAFGAAMGAEHVLKGTQVALGPAVALVRVPMSGRNFEYLSEGEWGSAAGTHIPGARLTLASPTSAQQTPT